MNKDKILIVEDNADLRAAVVRVLKVFGYGVQEAENGETALQMIRREDFDLVLTDLMMMGVNGLDVIRALKIRDPNAEALLMTAYGTLESNAEAMKLGVAGYLLKPVEIEELERKTRECLERRRLALKGSHSQEIASVLKMDRDTATALMLGSLLRHLLRFACDAVKADGGALVVEKERRLVVEAVTYNFRDEITGKTLDGEGGSARRAFETDETIIAGEPVPEEFWFNGFKDPRRVQSGLAAPLKDGARVIGVLCLSRSRGGAFAEGDAGLVAPFIDGMTYAIKNAAMYLELKQTYEALKAAQGRLIHSERMSAIGRVTSGLAHELNNPLVSVLGNVQLLLKEVPPENPWREDLKVIEQAAMICKRIVADLMGFARQGDFTFADTSVHRVLDKVLTLTRFQLEKGGVKVVKEWGRDVPALKASEPHLEQVFMNLVANAQQAMPSGGTLTIRSRVLGSADIPDRSADAFNDFPGVAAIEFSDSGVGIKKENLENILEPFFTTKEAGKGTGLGLSICREIVRRHHGEIYVESEGEGRGAKFTVMLPLNGEE